MYHIIPDRDSHENSDPRRANWFWVAFLVLTIPVRLVCALVVGTLATCYLAFAPEHLTGNELSDLWKYVVFGKSLF